MNDCTWTKRSDGLWTCEACGVARRWDRGGKPPRRNCAVSRGNQAARPGAPQTPADNAGCLHRGDVLRVEQCRTCQGAIEIPVYQCAVHGECTRENHARKNPALAGVQVCRGCPSAKLAEPALPGLATKAVNFAGAVARDLRNGRKRRSADLIAKIFDKHCKICPLFNSAEQACSACGCPVSNSDPEANKLAWASEKCPDDRWPIQTANLIYYVLPLRHPDKVWEWNVEQLRRRLSIFNGRRIVTIATKGPGERLGLEDPQKVIDAFGSDAGSIEFHTRPNDPQYWETPAFRAMLLAIYSGEPVADVDGRLTAEPTARAELDDAGAVGPPVKRAPSPSEATFYAHAKGVRRAIQTAVRPWTEAMYRHNLDRWSEVREILSVYPCCGIAKQRSRPFNLGDGSDDAHNWHFAGTFFWFHNASLFDRSAGVAPAWHDIPDHSHMVEGYLATQFEHEEAYCLAFENAGKVYSASTWAKGAGERSDTLVDAGLPRLARPQPTHPHGTNIQGPEERVGAAYAHRVSVIVTARNYGCYLRECLESCVAQKQSYPVEVIYSDDASTDNSLEIALGVPGVTVLSHPLHLGVAAARNAAAALATGDALLFVDGDNVLPEHYVAKLADRLEPHVPFVYPDLQNFGANTLLRQMPEFDAEALREANFCDSCSLIWRWAFDRAGGWRDGPWGYLLDWHLFLRLAKLGTPRRGGVALHYRIHEASMTAADTRGETPEAAYERRRKLLEDVDRA